MPEEDSKVIDVVALFSRILEHVYNPLEPFVPTTADSTASIRAAVGGSQQGSFHKTFLSMYVWLMPCSSASFNNIKFLWLSLHKLSNAASALIKGVWLKNK